ncbi:MAG: response regulator [Phycisphaerales bacterium]|nr:response regulator [Phycisphaerales bacterium]
MLWVVDDCPLIRKLTAVHCRPSRFECVGFEDPDALLEALRKAISENRPPKVILIDSEMPGLPGVEVVRGVRRAGFGGLVYLHTGTITPTLLALVVDSGADGAISKSQSNRKIRWLLGQIGTRKSG